MTLLHIVIELNNGTHHCHTNKSPLEFSIGRDRIFIYKQKPDSNKIEIEAMYILHAVKRIIVDNDLVTNLPSKILA